MLPTVPIHEPAILHHPFSITRFCFSAAELQFQSGNLSVEGSQGSNCRVTPWGDGYLTQISFPLGHAFSPVDPLLFSSFPSSVLPTSVLSFSNTCPAMISGAQTWLPRPTASLQTHFSTIPQIPAQPAKESPPCSRLAHPAVLPEGRLPGEAKARSATPMALGLQGTAFPRSWHCSEINLGVLGEHSTGREGRMGWDRECCHLLLASLGPQSPPQG